MIRRKRMGGVSMLLGFFRGEQKKHAACQASLSKPEAHVRVHGRCRGALGHPLLAGSRGLADVDDHFLFTRMTAEVRRISESFHVQSGTILSFVPCPAFQTEVVVIPVGTHVIELVDVHPLHVSLHSLLITVCMRLPVTCKPVKSLLASGRPAVVLLFALCAHPALAEVRALSEDIMI